LAQSAAPVGTAFTYQGQIKDAGVPADGTYDFEFRLYDSPVDGAQIGDPERRWGKEITAGLFTATLDFGPAAFNGEQRWLEVSVRRGGGGIGDPYTILSPRQALTATPYALYALSSPGGGGGFWEGSGNDIYNTNTGKVGVGTNAPAEMLHVIGPDPGMRLQDDGDTASYTAIHDDGSIAAAQLEKHVGPGDVPTVEINPIPGDGVSDARIRLFRRTETIGSKVVIFNRGDDSSAVSALIGVDGYDSWFQADGGNFGIGTNAPTHPLHLAGTANIMAKINSSNTAGTWLDFENTSAGGKRWGVVSTGSANGEGAGHMLLRNITDGRTVMTLRGAGSVGIGTTAPQARLHVDGGTDTAPGGGGYLVLGSTASSNISADNNEIQARNNGAVATLAINASGGNVNLIQSGTGNVGIGTTSPQAKLHVDAGTESWGVYGKATSATGWGGVFAGSGSFGGGQALMVTGDSLLAGEVEAHDVTISGKIDIGYQIVISAAVAGPEVVAYCPAGKKVLSGGCRPLELNYVGLDHPLNDGSGWKCWAEGELVQAYAICARVE
jgi:hypothetical protein